MTELTLNIGVHFGAENFIKLRVSCKAPVEINKTAATTTTLLGGPTWLQTVEEGRSGANRSEVDWR